MKYTANIITISRIVLSIILLFLLKHTTAFIVIYIVCGLSDAVDGMIARKTGTQSVLGAKLDSAADFFMFSVITASLIVWADAELQMLLPYVVTAILLRILSVIIAAFKYRTFAMIHTWGNKITGVMVFAAPIVYLFTYSGVSLLVVCIVSILSALEEMMIHITSKTPDLNRKSLFLRNHY